MRESLQDSLTRLLRYQRAPGSVTRLFRSWKHNADILPRFQAQLEMLLEAYGKFEPVVYDTQGIRDDGSDIVLRYRPENSDGEYELICFQVKSFDDLEKTTYMQGIKAQRDDSFRKILGMRHYFLLLCTDAKQHKDKMRSIMAEFRSADRTEVIEPAFAYTFFHHPKTRIEALVKRTMESEDFVFRLALDLLSLPSPFARALIVFMAVKFVVTGVAAFPMDDLLGDSILRNTFVELRDKQEALLEKGVDDETVIFADFETQVAEDLSLLETNVVELQPGSEAILLRTGNLRPLHAVIADALARYEHSEEQLISYMFSLMGVLD